MSLLLVEKHGHVALLTLNRPEVMNALGATGDGDAIRSVCESINRDQDIRCAILTGAGRAFSAGGDVKSMLEKSGAFAGAGIDIRESYRREFHALSSAIYNLEVPLIAAVNGAAVGLGCDLACLADIRIAAEDARFGVTFLKVGLIPGDGGAWLLQRVLGYSRAAELLYTGKLIGAALAAEWGLVSRVVPTAELLRVAFDLAGQIAGQPPHALRLAKSLMRHGRSTSYDAVMEMSAMAQALCHLTDDHIEGLSALAEKRGATFRGQ
ncbi:enoyl-CoA hydratase [Caballeronia udeis]|uniref:Enoyl-CoA hydratase n=1 Tax=Caballeronia udeis TaxID=1232866 RepID=A0A158GQW0_9BURK|nr:crotonase/enoyl-CoA hydratase family protein [Caballeronia udeis]SAL34267.1 enoyl-CoA hydratase [Caballeronia udeis]